MNNTDIDPEFIEECRQQFNKDPNNIIARNAVVSMGSVLATENSTEINRISHIFLNSLKKKNLKATNQGHSGRCWMFGCLNMFRHALINALNLPNFEFSEVYLFFWDKFERSNFYLQYFIDECRGKSTTIDRTTDWMISEYFSDGGYFNYAINLIQKYGLVPKDTMKETYQSFDSEDMNRIIKERLDAAASQIRRSKNNQDSLDRLSNLKRDTLRQIYDVLVKFLGEPPQTFTWFFRDDEDEPNSISNFTPQSFRDMAIPGLDLSDFIVLSHIPSIKYREVYEIKYVNNVTGTDNFRMVNVEINELAKYTVKSIVAGLPVWFVGDVCQSFNPYQAALDDKLNNAELVFGQVEKKFDKGERILFRDVQGNHAMTFVGVNVDDKGVPESWQVENSWGYYDNETPGMDGFLYMSHSWFQKYVTQVVVHRNFLSRTLRRLLDRSPVVLEPWTSIAPAMKAGCVDRPRIIEDVMRGEGGGIGRKRKR